MTVVAGVDFGTLSVRVTLVGSSKGPIGTASAAYPLHRRREDPDFATQSHADQMNALAEATREVLRLTGIDGRSVAAIALDTTGSSVIPVGENLEPLDDYYLWCDHRAHSEAEEITAKAHALGFEGIDWCGGVYSHEWGWAKLLHWLRHNPGKRDKFVTALEHCDMAAATLSGVKPADALKRSVCAMGHKWMWNPRWGGLPPEDFLVAVDPLLAGVREKIGGEYLTSDRIAGTLAPEWAAKLGLQAPAFPFPSARSTRTGTRSARTAARATWSTWSAPQRASLPWRKRSRARARRLRRGAGQRASFLHRHRGRPLRNWRHL